jgi:hypothetical protein
LARWGLLGISPRLSAAAGPVLPPEGSLGAESYALVVFLPAWYGEERTLPSPSSQAAAHTHPRYGGLPAGWGGVGFRYTTAAQPGRPQRLAPASGGGERAAKLRPCRSLGSEKDQGTDTDQTDATIPFPLPALGIMPSILGRYFPVGGGGRGAGHSRRSISPRA